MRRMTAACFAAALFASGCGGGGPRVVAVSPAPEEAGVALDAKVEVVFDRPVRLEEFETPLALILDGVAVPGEVSVGEGGNPLTFTPRFFLLAERRYQARLGGPGLSAFDGKKFSESREWSFDTVAGCSLAAVPEAKLPAGPDGLGGTVIPGGRRVTPAGSEIELGSFPTNARLSPDGRWLAVVNCGCGLRPGLEQSLMVFDTIDGRMTAKVPRSPPLGYFYGLAFSPDGSRLYAAGGSAERVEVFSVGADGTLTEQPALAVEGFPAGIELSPDGATLYVADQTGGEAVALDTATGNVRWRTPIGMLPYDVAVSPDGARVFVSLWGRAYIGEPGRVASLDAASGELGQRMDVGKNPEDLLMASDGRLFVACADADRVDVIDAAAERVIASWPLRAAEEPVGLSPVGLALDEAAGRLYVACAQKNSVDVLSLADGARLGSVPTGWYPTAAAIHPGGRLWVVSGKGRGSGPNTVDVFIGSLMRGTLFAVPAPDAAALEAGARTVRENNEYPLRFYPERCLQGAFPVPRAPGQPSPIKHVIFVLRENKTYDQNLGDLSGTNGDPALVEFGEDVTPNLHALARTFCNLENFHADIEVSVQGHYWNAAATINDYAEKVWHPMDRDGSRLPATSAQQVDYPAGLFIWHRLQEAGVSFRNYGEPMGVAGEYDRFADSVNMDYMLDRGENLYLTPDATHVEWFLTEKEAGLYPSFVFLGLLNDHTYGTKPGLPDPVWMVAENDYATGLLVERLSHDPEWPETLIIVTEDDPQSGMDHVDNHRSIALLISPYTRTGYTSSVHYDFSSLIRTYGLILGFAPLNLLDAVASPVYDCFTSKPDFTPYTAIPNPIPYSVVPEGAPGSALSRRMDFSAPDRAPGLGEILWRRTRPDEPVPERLRWRGEADRDCEDADEEDDDEPRRVLPVPLERPGRSVR
ncbi:MAG: beta-propeller fold lactonase family protein [Myxococcales bacterium]|nr:beta-propeller fold lactonase family protein [Myxococcales bacterium]